MKILVVGAGMYVTGRHGTGVGTILASLLQASRVQRIDEVLVVARSADNAGHVAEAAARLNTTLGTKVPVRYQALASGRPLGDQLRLADLAAAVVCVPDHLHFAITAELLGAGVPSLVVKPLVPTVAEARQLIALQEQTRTFAAVEFHKRWDQSNLLLKRNIADGKLGALVYGLVEYSQRISIPTDVFKSWVAETNIFQYLGVHYVDLFSFLTGLQPLRAMAVGTRGVLAARGIDTWDSVHGQILWGKMRDDARPLLTQLTIGWIDPTVTSALSDQRIKIIGEHGRIECDQKDRGITSVTEAGGIQHVNPYFADFLPDGNGGLAFQGYGYESIATFLRDVESIRTGMRTYRDFEGLRPTLRSSLPSTAVVEAINQSLREDFCWRTVEDAKA